MRNLFIYKVKYDDNIIKIYKTKKLFYEDYKLITDDKRHYENFRYTISLLKQEQELKEKELKENEDEDEDKKENEDEENEDEEAIKKIKKIKNKKLLIDSIEIFNFIEFLQPYLIEYKQTRNVKDSGYTKTTNFYNKIYVLAKYRIENSI